MDTRDLDSYYPGYEDFEERDSKISSEEYKILEDKIEMYEKAREELEEILEDDRQYKPLEIVKLSKSIIEDLKKELGIC